MTEVRDPPTDVVASGETIYTVGGAVQATQGVYIPRRADDELLALCRAGSFAYILSPRQLGKSSLMIHTAERLAAEGIRVALLDLTAIGTQVSAADWYFGLLYEIADQLALTTDLYTWWQSRAELGPTQRFTRFFKEVVLAEVSAPVVVFVDEIDTTLSLPFADDFFAAIRAFHDARAQVDLGDPAGPGHRLSFVLIGVATPGDLVHDPKRTPFNVGQRVEMTDFSLDEATPLAEGLGLPPAAARQVLRWVLDWTGGHPYLTQRLCQALTQEQRRQWSAPAVAAVVGRLFFGAESAQDNNIQFVRDMLTKRAPDQVGVLQLYREVRRGRPVPDEEHSLVQSHLKLAGIVRSERQLLRVRNPIYRTVFDDRWIKAHLPANINWVRGLRRTFAALLVLFVLSVTALGIYANARREEAEQAKTLAEARELAIRAQTAPDPEVGLLLALAAGREVQDGQVPDAGGQIARVLSQAIGNSHVRLRLPHPAALTGVTWADTQTLATTAADGQVRLWSLQPAPAPPGNTAPLVAFSSAGAANAVAWGGAASGPLTAGPGNVATVWDGSTGAPRLVLRGHSGEVLDVDWSRAANLFVTASRDNTAIIWDAAGQPLRTLSGHSGWVRSAAFSPDGRFVVTASADTTARVWDVATGQARLSLRGHIRDVRAAAWSPDGTRIVTASEDGTARIWDATTGQEQVTLHGHSGPVEAAGWSPDGRLIVTAGADGTARIWDANAGGSGPEPLVLRGHTDEVVSAAFSSDGRLVATASADGTARVWALENAAARVTLPGTGGPVLAAQCSPDGTILMGSADGSARSWLADSGVTRLTVRSDLSAVQAVAWSPDGRQFASGAADGTARIWDSASGQTRNILRGYAAGVNSLAFSPDGRLIATASADGSVRVWDAAQPAAQEQDTFRSPAAAVRGVGWSPDGRLLVGADDDGAARVWDLAGDQPRLALQGHGDAVNSAAFSPDGRVIVTASDDGTARTWDAATGQALLVFKGHGDAVLSAAWSPDGRFIVTASADGTARVWDAASGQERLVFSGPGGTINQAGWCLDGRYVLTADSDGGARLYPVDLADLLALAATRVTRALTAEEQAQLGILPTPAAPTARSVAQASTSSPTSAPTASAQPSAVVAGIPSALAGPTSSPLPTPPPDPTGRIAFASNRGSPPESHVYVMRPDGTDQHVLTTAPLENLYPDWSPDGTRLVYVGANPKIISASPAGDIYLMNADGTNRTQLTHGLNAKWPKWSPDGGAILYADGPENRSPVYDLYLITLAGGAIRRLTDAPGFDGYAAWTPDGRIIFTSARVDNTTHLFSMNGDGSNPQQLVFLPGEQESPAVAPDGSRIAFVSTQDGTEHIYTMARDGSDVRQITTGAGADRYPSWSPDGNWIAFHSNRDDRNNFEIYIVPAGGGAVRRLTVGSAYDDEPAWHR